MASLRHYDVTPVTGYMDARSSPDQTPIGGYRYCQNFGVETKSKLCRLPGWTKYLDREAYNNHDLRDQLQSLTGAEARVPITMLFEAESTFGATKLLAATDRNLFALNITTGNWQVLWSGFGQDGLRLYATQNQDNVIFTNDFDEPQYWTFDQPLNEGSSFAVSPIDDLQALGVTRAAVVVTWAGATFLMNVVQNGRSFQNRIVWSDFQNGLSYIQGEESIAGDQDLDFGETILGALPLANVLLIYTTRGIWQANRSGDPENAFSFAKRYDAKSTGSACLQYRNTLVSKGDEHIYGAQDGIYSYSLFTEKPERVEWIHRGSSLVFDDINNDTPELAVAGFNPIRNEVSFSWARSSESQNSRTFLINTEFPFTSIVDHGFSAFGTFKPREPVTIFEDFLLGNCICTAAELTEFGIGQPPIGGQCETPEETVCDTQPDSFFTTVPLELEDGIVTEDFNEAEPSENSLCARLAGLTLATTCVAENTTASKASRNFVMASTTDFCLKQMSNVFYREVCIGFRDEEENDVHFVDGDTSAKDRCGTYQKRGYRSLLRSGPINLKDTEDEKRIQRFVMEAEAAVAAVPGQVKLRIGASAQALDPNQTGCAIIWTEEATKFLHCLSPTSEAAHKANNTRPDEQYAWPLWTQGINIFFELTFFNDDSTPYVDTGAAVCISRYTLFADEARRRYA